MNKYFTSSDTHRVTIDDEHWIEIKNHLSVADQDQITQRTMGEATISSGGNRAERRRASKEGTKLTFKPSTQVTLEVAIVSWSFKDDKGEALPVTPDNIGKLQPWVANLVLEAIEELNPLERRNTQ